MSAAGASAACSVARKGGKLKREAIPGQLTLEAAPGKPKFNLMAPPCGGADRAGDDGVGPTLAASAAQLKEQGRALVFCDP